MKQQNLIKIFIKIKTLKIDMKKSLIILMCLICIAPAFAQDELNDSLDIQKTFSAFMFSFQALGIIAIIVTVVFFIFYYVSKIRAPKKKDEYGPGGYYERRI